MDFERIFAEGGILPIPIDFRDRETRLDFYAAIKAGWELRHYHGEYWCRSVKIYGPAPICLEGKVGERLARQVWEGTCERFWHEIDGKVWLKDVPFGDKLLLMSSATNGIQGHELQIEQLGRSGGWAGLVVRGGSRFQPFSFGDIINSIEDAADDEDVYESFVAEYNLFRAIKLLSNWIDHYKDTFWTYYTESLIGETQDRLDTISVTEDNLVAVAKFVGEHWLGPVYGEQEDG